MINPKKAQEIMSKLTTHENVEEIRQMTEQKALHAIAIWLVKGKEAVPQELMDSLEIVVEIAESASKLTDLSDEVFSKFSDPKDAEEELRKALDDEAQDFHKELDKRYGGK